MKIAVTTPTGQVGRRLVPLLLQAGERPTLLVRDAARLDPHVRAASDVVELDLGDVDAVVAATAGVDALYWVDPPTQDDDPAAGYARVGAVGAHAVQENGIPRVVFQSSGGADARGGFGEIDGLARTEEMLDATGASVTHLRCGYFFSNLFLDLDSLRGGELTTTLPLDLRIPWVAPADIATVGALRLLSTAWRGRHTQGVYGPADLSFSDVATVVSAAIGRDVVARRVSDDDVAAQLRAFGMSDAQVEGIVGMSRGLRGPHVPEDPRDVRSTTPTTLAGWAFAELRPAL
ncbi:NmrA family protein [Beutenbergia cavernae DSM 12333]|uniref:NmrA family protein n=1 Tax=Beutenbergia cavernae (strain ATCC BAA-8 / DSM 12333 / CCUG 43141 / JCM 11478 / NBRC 16432 / NCIMB 13614 / HKI 0122) TaxID=471853 RepID=C5C5E7_BEUC1|nr:NAD(P)H-binding protein [Beutenbergia cavernae]ACQ82287.1 NmrA family protein [Beutenbergia cavernae DSM 12333]